MVDIRDPVKATTATAALARLKRIKNNTMGFAGKYRMYKYLSNPALWLRDVDFAMKHTTSNADVKAKCSEFPT